MVKEKEKVRIIQTERIDMKYLSSWGTKIAHSLGLYKLEVFTSNFS